MFSPCRQTSFVAFAATLACVFCGAGARADNPARPLGHPAFYPSPQRPVGWRGDGSGWFPGATVPNSWGDGEPANKTIVVHYERRGRKYQRKQSAWLTRSPVPRNIVWKTPLPGWGNSSPVVAGDRIFLTCEPRHLLCLDAHTGDILWTAELNPFALDPQYADRAARLAKLLDIARVLQALQEHCLGSRGTPNFEPANRPRLQLAVEKLGKCADDLRGVDPDAAATLDKHCERFQAHLNRRRQKVHTTYAEYVGRKYGVPVAENMMSFVGWTCATPVTDGKHVFVSMGQGQVACFDYAGRQVWGRRFALEHAEHASHNQHAASPLLIGRVLVVQLKQRLIGLDKATGRLLWQAKDPRADRTMRPPGSARAMHLDSPRGGVDVVVTTCGQVLRASDGGELLDLDLRQCATLGMGPSLVGTDDTVIFHAGRGRAAEAIAWRLRVGASGRVEKELVWKTPCPTAGTTDVVTDKLLIQAYRGANLFRLDTGAAAGEETNRDAPPGMASAVLAGHVLVMPSMMDEHDRTYPRRAAYMRFSTARLNDGHLGPWRMSVLVSTDRPRVPSIKTRLPKMYAGNAWGRESIPPEFGHASPFAQGNRLFVRSNSHMYCIGDPLEAYTSRRHTKRVLLGLHLANALGLRKALMHGLKQMRMDALDEIATRGPKVAELAPDVFKRLSDKERCVRLAAGRAIGPVSTVAPRTIALLMEMIKGDDAAAAEAAMIGLRSFGPRAASVAKEVAGWMGDSNDRLRYWAEDILVSIGPAGKNALPLLKELAAKAKDASTRAAAERAITHIQKP